MFKLLMYGAMGYAGYRAYQAHTQGVPFDEAFRPDRLLTPVKIVKARLIAHQTPEIISYGD